MCTYEYVHTISFWMINPVRHFLGRVWMSALHTYIQFLSVEKTLLEDYIRTYIQPDQCLNDYFDDILKKYLLLPYANAATYFSFDRINLNNNTKMHSKYSIFKQYLILLNVTSRRHSLQICYDCFQS